MLKSELRENDIKQSDIVSDFLDSKLYSLNEFSNVERIHDKEKQINGIDIEFVYGGKKYLCDEKSAINYVNKGLKTFALEISFLNRKKELSEGWFINNDLLTDSYLFTWIDKGTVNHINNMNQILEVEVVLIEKNVIIEHLKSEGWNNNTLWVKSNRIRNNENEYMGDIDKYGYKFSYSPKFFEKPVNIIFPRQFYRDNCIFNKKIVSI